MEMGMRHLSTQDTVLCPTLAKVSSVHFTSNGLYSVRFWYRRPLPEFRRDDFSEGLQELRNRWGGAKAARGRANDQQVRLTQLICRHLAGRQRFDISF